MSEPERSQTVASIQVLRAVAALAVLLPHVSSDFARYLNRPDALPAFPLGGAGVDLFFVISGFVMVYASEPLYARRNGPVTFFSHRLIRIVPLYWIVTTYYLAISVAVPHFLKNYPPSFVIASYLFVPLPRPDGVMEPLVGQGWTLIYEMQFYVIFALAIVAPRRLAAMAASLALIALVVLGRLAPSLSPTFARWTDPIILEFMFGIAIGLAYREGLKLPRPLALCTIAAGIAQLLVFTYYFPLRLPTVSLGIPAAFVVAGSSLGRFSLSGAAWRPLVVIGEASYALYLFHPTPDRFIILVSRWVGFDLGRFPWSYFVASAAAAIAVAIAIHYWIERPLTAFLRRRATFARLPAGPVVAAAPGLQPTATAAPIMLNRNRLSP